ncbi:MAG: metallophosphoesterase family protein [Acidobacteria bacterium]|nr:metallophosphoesterase family protein [Acidobacteriota bacterium]
MRIAVVSDIHGNLTALDAVIADLKEVSPDLIVHGGDLLGGGARQAEVVDRIRDLNWPGVHGNTDEMLWNPDRAAEHLRAPALQRVREITFQFIAAAVDAIGEERLTWLRTLPTCWSGNDLTVVHAGPDDVWRSPSADASDEELVNTYGSLGSRRVIYGHIHRAYLRQLPSFALANSGSVSLSYDGDPRSAYAVVDDDQITIRRVEYDIEREVKTLFEMQYPYAAWVADMLRKGTYVPPPG